MLITKSKTALLRRANFAYYFDFIQALTRDGIVSNLQKLKSRNKFPDRAIALGTFFG